MPNIGKMLKDEIARLARRQSAPALHQARQDLVRLRKAQSQLRRQVESLAREVQWLAAQARQAGPVEARPEDIKGRWITARGIRALRRRLGLSQSDFGKLAGVSSLTVALWEKKAGKVEIRRERTMARLQAVRAMGAREARKELESRFGVDLKKRRSPRFK